jgi:ParB-like chromosome segregation protein Spo0J
MKPNVVMVPLADVLPNPYRKIKHYPLSEEKLDKLIQSFDTSGFWDGSIQGRPSDDGKIEIAFGHHRIEAARRRKLDAVGIVVAKRSNADMLRMMADENAAEFQHDAWIGVETIAAVVDAYDRGDIELDAVEKEDKGREHLPDGKCYSLATVARFLRWVKPSDGQATAKCRAAFDAYRQRATTAEAVQRLAPDERSEVAIKTITDAARSARTHGEKAGLKPAQIREAEKKAARRAVDLVQESSGFKAREESVAIGRQAVRAVAGRSAKNHVPEIEFYAAKLIARCEKAEPYADILTDCYRLVPFIDDLTEPLARRLAKALAEMLGRSSTGVAGIVRALRSGNHKKIAALLEKGA